MATLGAGFRDHADIEVPQERAGQQSVECDENIAPEDMPPRPPDFLIDRVVSGFDTTEVDEARQMFDHYGRQSLFDINTALAGLGRSLGDFSQILDFGCGCARILRWLPAEVTKAQIFGCDIDEQAIEWCQQHFPEMDFLRNNFEPPLPYADQTFDLILNHSVFTHIDERMQDLWLAELCRVLKPEGLALLSVHGSYAFGLNESAVRFEGDTAAVWRRELERHGILYLTSDEYVGSSFPNFYHTTFHAPWYVFDHWSRWLTVRAYLPQADLGFQDIVLLQRNDGENRMRPIAAAPSDRPSDRSDDAPEQESLQATPTELDTNRMPPVVAAALERLGQRVTRLEGAVADRLSST
jgi:SAM-dependent methyltransferase